MRRIYADLIHFSDWVIRENPHKSSLFRVLLLLIVAGLHVFNF